MFLNLGIIGFGRIGKEVAKIALGIGMKVVANDGYVGEAIINVPFYYGQSIDVKIETEAFEEVIKLADFITLHVPNQEEYIIGDAQFKIMKDGVGIINAARGGVIDEVGLVKAIYQLRFSRR